MRILFDSDAIFALYIATDTNHKKAKRIFQKLLESKTKNFITDWVMAETATVLSYKIGHEVSLDFLARFKRLNFKHIFLDQKLEQLAWEIFRQQTKKGTSFVDCANLAVFRELKMDKLFSFDSFYKRMKVKTLA